MLMLVFQYSRVYNLHTKQSFDFPTFVNHGTESRQRLLDGINATEGEAIYVADRQSWEVRSPREIREGADGAGAPCAHSGAIVEGVIDGHQGTIPR